jgi:hypothetical protein
MFRIFPLLILFSGIIGCSKVNLEQDFAAVIGDYDWVYSEAGTANYSAFDSSSDQYGIRLKQKRKMLLFKNGIVLKTYTITLVNTNNEVYTLSAESDNTKVSLVIEGDELVTSQLPFDGYNNHFKKKV